MNKTAIILDYDPFVRESRIYVNREEKSEQYQVVSTMADMINTIIDLAYQNNIYNVFVNAPKDITNEIHNTINEYERNQYSINRIKVEGM